MKTTVTELHNGTMKFFLFLPWRPALKSCFGFQGRENINVQSIIWSQKSALFEISINDIAKWTCWLVYRSVDISRYMNNVFGQQNSKPEI